MNGRPVMRHGGGLALLLVLGLLLAPALSLASGDPPPEPQRQSFSVTVGSPLLGTGVDPADILIAGPIQWIPCGSLGLVCGPTLIEWRDQLGGLSYGFDFIFGGPPVQFSVSYGAHGASGTAVRAEADCSPSEAQADSFASQLRGSNTQILDGDGVSCAAGNAAPGLGLAETPASDDVGALAGDPCLTVDLDCDGAAEGPIFFTLLPGSPALKMLGAGSADILSVSQDTGPALWGGAPDLGLVQEDAIDALCLREDGDGRYGPSDWLAFSLAPGSPTLARLDASPADILVPGGPTVFAGATRLGLERTDNVDGLLCAFDVFWRYLPMVLKGG
jgi:hypothetical protein